MWKNTETIHKTRNDLFLLAMDSRCKRSGKSWADGSMILVINADILEVLRFY